MIFKKVIFLTNNKHIMKVVQLINKIELSQNINDYDLLLEKMTKDYLEDLDDPVFLRDSLNKLSLYSVKHYIEVPNRKSSKYKKFKVLIIMFKNKLMEKIIETYNIKPSKERTVTPHIDALKWVPHNFMDIEPTGKEYGLLIIETEKARNSSK